MSSETKQSRKMGSQGLIHEFNNQPRTPFVFSWRELVFLKLSAPKGWSSSENSGVEV